MRNFAALMQRLLEIQSYETHRSPKVITEDRQLMDSLQKRSPARKPPHTAKLSPDGRMRERLKA